MTESSRLKTHILTRFAFSFFCIAAAARPVHAQTSSDVREIVKLSGPWQARHDATNRGFVEGFPGGGPSSGWIDARVPGVLEEQEPFAGKDGVFWLKTKFNITTPPPADRRLRLQFERVVENCKIWLNGAEIGAHGCGDTPFFIDITEAALPGENILVLRLEDTFPARTAEIMALGGICGDVFLERVATLTVEDLKINYRPERGPGIIEVGARCENLAADSSEAQLKFEVTIPGSPKVVASASIEFTIPAGELASPKMSIQIPQAVPWNVDSPQLYQISARLLKNGVPMDSMSRVTGLRTVKIERDRFVINNEAIRLRTVVDLGYEPGSLLLSSVLLEPSRKVKLLKDAGFNAIITRGRQPSRALVRAANEQGMLIFEYPTLRIPAVSWAPSNGLCILSFAPAVDTNHLSQEALSTLQEQIARDRNDPSVVWWGFDDVSKKWIDGARAFDDDNIFSRDARTFGRNYYYNPGDPSFHYYLRADIYFEMPWGFGDRDRLLDFGDRDEFAFIHFKTGFGASDLNRAVNGLGGESWREEARAYLPRIAKFNENYKDCGFGGFFTSPEAMLDQIQTLHADSLRHAMDAMRCNKKLSGFSVGYTNDSPMTPGEGLLDTLGRPKPEYVAAAKANYFRRCFILPRLRAAEAPGAGVMAPSIEVDCAAIAEKGDPIQIITIEMARPEPDRLYGQTVPGKNQRWPWLLTIPLACAGSPGAYMLNPVYKDLKFPDIEATPILGVPVPKIIFGGTVENVSVGDNLAFLGTNGDPWDENRFIQNIDALEIARAGGIVVIANGSTPGDPFDAAGVFPGVRVTRGSGLVHAACDPRLVEGLQQKGILNDPLNEILTMNYFSEFPKGSEILSVVLNDRGLFAGAGMLKIPYGRGFVIITTFRLAEKSNSDVVARRILSNIATMVGSPVPQPDAGTPPVDRAKLLERFREYQKKRGN